MFPPQWGVVWCKGLQLTTNLLSALSHQYLSHAIDFVGVYQEKLMLVSGLILHTLIYSSKSK